MERESFEDQETAALMNELFVNIKVDREERPDLDAIYMDAVQALTGQGGWPMSVFLTPAGQPFYGGTYYPPEPRYGMPSFQQVLRSISHAYEHERDKITGQASHLTDMLSRTGAMEASATDLGSEILDEALQTLQQIFDEQDGGFGSQPKFPQPMTLDFAMTQYQRTGDEAALYLAELTLFKMAHGGIYDQLGGGFHRYSVDAYWLVPHFEKMLYDNAQLLRTYLNAWRITQRPLYRRIVEETITYLLREMTAPDGGFYSTQDADSEGEEGRFFVWTPAEIHAVLGPRIAAVFEDYYDVSARGNFDGQNILNIVKTVEEVAARFNMSVPDVEHTLAIARGALFEEREQRVKPGCDEKILAEWNGLMIHALAECGVALEHEGALNAAMAAADFVLSRMRQVDGRLCRSFKDGRARFNAYLEDYSAVIRGLIALWEATGDPRWLDDSLGLTEIVFAQFHDAERGGFYQTGTDHEELVVRRKDFIDNAIPSGNSVFAEALLRLSTITGRLEFRDEAARVLIMMKDAMARQPTGFGRMLGVLDGFLAPSREVVIVGPPEDERTRRLQRVLQIRYMPHTISAHLWPEGGSDLPILAGRTQVDRRPTAYVCQNYACNLPVVTPEELSAQL